MGGMARCLTRGSKQTLLVLTQPPWGWVQRPFSPCSWGRGPSKNMTQAGAAGDEVMWKNTQVRTKLSFCRRLGSVASSPASPAARPSSPPTRQQRGRPGPRLRLHHLGKISVTETHPRDAGSWCSVPLLGPSFLWPAGLGGL